MMKFTGLFHLAAGGVLLVPAVALQSGGGGSLEQSLRRTLAALEDLARIERRIGEGEAGAVAQAIAATEAPIPDPAGEPGRRDQRLAQLREEVAGLQASLELAPPQDSALAPRDASPAGTPAATTGLDEGTLRWLAQGLRSPIAPLVPSAEQGPAAAAAAAAPPVSFEPDGYAADALRLARALYRQGRYAEALNALEGRSESAEAAYWRARALEKLGRTEDALAAYLEVAGREDGGFHAKRAGEDAEFLQWRVDFERREEARARKEPR